MTQYKRFAWLRATLLIIMLLIDSTFAFAQTAENDKQNILIINSYEPDNPWTHTEEEGLEKGLEMISGQIRIFHEYMDSKRLHGSAYDSVFTRYLLEKYKYTPIDLVVTTDDYATQYVKNHRSEFLKEKIPVVFMGVNDLTFKEPYFVGVYENIDIGGTIDLVKIIHGEETPIIIFTDKTLSSESIVKSLLDDPDWLNQRGAKLVMENNLIAAKRHLSNFRDGVVIFLLFNEDDSGKTYTYYEGLDMVRESTDLPIYSVWDFYIGHGIVGGSLITEKEMGESASNLITRLLSGEDYTVLSNTATKAKKVLDYPVMTHYGIDKSKIIDKATIVNEPVTFWGEYYQLMMLFISVLAIFIIIIGLLINNIRQKTKYYTIVGEHKNEIVQANQKLEKRVLESQNKVADLTERNHELAQYILEMKKKVGFAERLPFIFHEINVMLGTVHSRIAFLQAQSERLERNEAKISAEKQFDELRELLSEALVNCEINMESTIQLVGASKTCYSDLAVTDPRNYKISVFVESFWLMIKPTLKKKKVSFVAKIPEEVSLYGNPGDFLTILAILFGNSLRHGYPMHPERGLKIEIEAYMSQHMIHLVYRDDGDGCPTEKLENAINGQLETAALHKSGIGLYQLNAIVTDTMNGQVSISGDVDEGIQVRINIPKAGEHNEL